MFRFKRFLSAHFPDLAGTYHALRITREMRKHSLKLTPFGFYFLGHARMQSGAFEPDETRFVERIASEVDIFIDIGANIGYFTCLMRNLGKHVVAVEPLRQNLDVLYANVAANGWQDIEVFPVGLSDTVGIVEIFGGGTGASLIPYWAGTSGVLRNTIPVNSLDNLVGERFAGKRVLIKIDVEGAEFAVLRGAERLSALQPAPRWLLEICLTEHHPDGLNPHYLDIFSFFFERGYSAFTIDGDMRPVTQENVSRWLRTRTRDFGYVSYLFEKRS
jgi:FkbM family methyltransferase